MKQVVYDNHPALSNTPVSLRAMSSLDVIHIMMVTILDMAMLTFTD